MRNAVRRTVIDLARATGSGRAASWLAARAPRRPRADRPQATVFSSAPASCDTLAVVAHHDPLGEFSEASAFTADALRGLGATVVVVSTVPVPHDVLAATVESHADAIVTRGNEGFDFQSWQRGLELASREGWWPARTLLVNTSMYGPVSPVGTLVAEMFARYQVWGMTESLDLVRHVQSWWLSYGAEATTGEPFERFWHGIRPSSGKWGTILPHELRWARDSRPPGSTVGVVAPVARHRCRRNPLFFAWRDLVADHGVPFVKRSLFLDNHDRIDMTGWRAFLDEAAPGFDVGLVERDLQRLGVPSPPG